MFVLGTAIAILGFLFFLNGFLSQPESVIHQVYTAIYMVGGAAVGTLGLILAQLGRMHHTARAQKESALPYGQRVDAICEAPKPQPLSSIPPIEEVETRAECPHCGQHFSYSANASDKTINCVHCGNEIVLS